MAPQHRHSSFLQCLVCAPRDTPQEASRLAGAVCGRQIVVLSCQTLMAGCWAVQDCGKPYYLENYIAFFEALRAVHLQLRLVANCNMGNAAPTDLYDWHVYTGAHNLQIRITL